MVSFNYNAERGSHKELVGTTLGSARLQLSAPYGIPRHAECRVNGNWVGDDYRLRRGDDLEFVVLRGQKGGDVSTEKELLRLGVNQEKLEAFRRDPDNRPSWGTFRNELVYEDVAVHRWLNGYEKPVVSLNSTCEEALVYFGKTAVPDDLSLPQSFYVVAAYWNEAKGLSAAGIRDAFRKIDRSGYAFPESKRPGYERAKAAIRRGREVLEKLS